MKTTVDVLVAVLCYGGNGGVATIIPEIAFWLLGLQKKLVADQRIGRVEVRRYGDVPLTFERNRISRDAVEGGFDLTLSLDSDNQPDIEVGKKPWAEPFWESSFDFIFDRMVRGLPTVMVSPYCGPPPQENIYVFKFENEGTGRRAPRCKLEQYGRNHAAIMRGIQPCDAGPTGVILITTSAYYLLQFDKRPTAEILSDFKAGTIDMEATIRKLRSHSWFRYDSSDGFESHKTGTEDVIFTRDVAMAGQFKHGEPVVFCNWDSWSGHWKPICVMPPTAIALEDINAMFEEAVLANRHAGEELREVDFTKNLPPADARERPPTPVVKEFDDPFIEEEDDDPAATLSRIAQELFHGKSQSTAVTGPPIPLVQRMIGGRKVTSIGHQTPMHELDVLSRVAQSQAKINWNGKGGRSLRCLEVGSWVGESALAIAAGCPPGSTVYCVDTWQGSPSDWTGHIATQHDPWEWFQKNVGDALGNAIKPLRGKSLEVARSFGGESQDLDLIFIDGSHDAQDVYDDIVAWFGHLSENGVMIGHDYCEAFPGVIDAVDDWFEQFGLQPELIAGTSFWMARMPKIAAALNAMLSRKDAEVKHADQAAPAAAHHPV